MFPPIFETVNVAPVQALLKTGSGPLRFFMFGMADQNTPTPYAVWQMVYGTPENYINQVPDVDSFGLQVDVYASQAQGADVARQVAEALRDAIEPRAHITAWRGESRDPDTKDFVFTFEVDWIVNR